MPRSDRNLVRFGIIGFGRFAARSIAPAFGQVPSARLVAVQKRSLADAHAQAAEFGIPHAFDTPEALVVHPEVDAVFIASANSAHAPETFAAARAGKHVLVEKPMALTVDEAEAMIAVCAERGVKLMVGHMVRFSPLALRMRNIVQSGLLGPIVSAHAEFLYDARLTRRSWLYDAPTAGGGPVFDVGVHCLDTLRFILDDEVSTVTTLLDRPVDNHTENTAHLSLRFSRGTVASIFCSYRSPFRRRFIEIIGTEAIMSAPDFTAGELTIPLTLTPGQEGMPADSRIEQIDVPNLYAAEISHLAECILSDRDPLSDGENGVKNQRVLAAAVGQPLPQPRAR